MLSWQIVSKSLGYFLSVATWGCTASAGVELLLMLSLRGVSTTVGDDEEEDELSSWAEVWVLQFALLYIASETISLVKSIILLLLLLDPDQSLVKIFCLAGIVCLGRIPLWVFGFSFLVPLVLLPVPVAFNLLLLLPAGVLESNRSWLSLIFAMSRTTLSTSWLTLRDSWFQVVVAGLHNHCCCGLTYWRSSMILQIVLKKNLTTTDTCLKQQNVSHVCKCSCSIYSTCVF